MTDKIGKLDKRDITRLLEIKESSYTTYGKCPITTERLTQMGYVKPYGGEWAKNGRLKTQPQACLTDLGRHWFKTHLIEEN